MSEDYVLDKPTGLTCPECGGVVAKIDDKPIPKYVCHIGHVLTGEAMLEAQAERIEDLLSGALAMLNERRELCRQILKDGLGDDGIVRSTLDGSTKSAELIRDLLNRKGEGASALASALKS